MHTSCACAQLLTFWGEVVPAAPRVYPDCYGYGNTGVCGETKLAGSQRQGKKPKFNSSPKDGGSWRWVFRVPLWFTSLCR